MYKQYFDSRQILAESTPFYFVLYLDREVDRFVGLNLEAVRFAAGHVETRRLEVILQLK